MTMLWEKQHWLSVWNEKKKTVVSHVIVQCFLTQSFALTSSLWEPSVASPDHGQKTGLSFECKHVTGTRGDRCIAPSCLEARKRLCEITLFTSRWQKSAFSVERGKTEEDIGPPIENTAFGLICLLFSLHTAVDALMLLLTKNMSQ